MDLQLADKTALVTGGYRGTGAVIATTLAAEGARVIVHGFEPGDTDATLDAIHAANGSATAVSGDLMSDEGAEQLGAQLVAAGSRVDILVNNFGRADPANWSGEGTGDWIEALDVNLLSAVRLAKLISPQMKKRGWGRIIQLGTIGSTRPNAQMPGLLRSQDGSRRGDSQSRQGIVRHRHNRQSCKPGAHKDPRSRRELSPLCE